MDKERERIRQEIYGRPEGKSQEQSDTFGRGNNIEVSSEVNPKLLAMFPPERLRRIMKKEARKYKAALGKKWNHWLEAVSK